MATKNSQPKTISEKVGNVSIPIYRTKSKGYAGFTVAWYENGKRSRKFFADLMDARTHARLVATKIENQEREVLNLTPEDSRIYANAVAQLRPLKIPLDAAIREFVGAREIVGDYPILQALKYWKTHQDKVIPDKSVAEVVLELVQGLKKDGASLEHVVEMERTLGKFADSFQTNIGNITTTEINDYLRGLKASASTRNVYRRKIVTLFNYARRVNYLPDSITVATKAKKVKERGKEIEIYSHADMVKLLQHASDNLRPFIVLCGFCGLRSAEARRLEWKEVDFVQGTILVAADKSKTQTRRFAPLPKNAAEWLKPHAKSTGKVVKVVMVVNALRRLGLRAKVKMKRNGLRHSFCSYRLTSTQNANQTALEAGHSVEILFQHYRQLCTEAEAKSWFSIAPTVTTNVIPMVATA